MAAPIPPGDRRASSLLWRHYHDWKESVERIFDKKRVLKDIHDEEVFKLPNTSQFFQKPLWKIDSLMTLKEKLNQMKDRLDKYDFNVWHKHTAAMNPPTRVLQLLRNKFGSEYTSKAWAKIMEFLWSENIIPATIIEDFDRGQDASFNSVHLCEGPGGYLAGINHYIATNHNGLKWKWLATTLNPYHEANGIQRVLEEDNIIRASHKNWTFLADDTGDIMNQRNIEFLVQKVGKQFSSVDLVTADGSVDCQGLPNEQEKAVFGLLYAEIVTALQILSKNGTLILKIFTIFECQTICYLYLLSSLFAEVKIVKPVLSKEGNSEVHVICMGYYGFPSHLKTILAFSPGTPSILGRIAMFPLTRVPEAFIQKVVEASHFFTDCQMSAISRNISTFGDERIYTRVWRNSHGFANKWVKRFEIKPLDPALLLFQTSDSPRSKPRFVIRAFASRNSYKNLIFNENLGQDIRKRLGEIAGVSDMPADRSGFVVREIFKIERVKIGKQYKNILGSPFCKGRLLQIRQQLREIVSENFKPSSIGAQKTPHCTDSEIKEKLSSVVANFKNEKNKLWSMKTLCYHETLEVLVKKTDAEATLMGLMALVDTLENLEKNTSVFLCEFPLLTRLHIGFIFALTNCFEKISIGYNKGKNLQGVLLYNFKGFNAEPDLLENLIAIVTALEEKVPNEAVLECIPIQILRTSKYTKELFNYNMTNVFRGIQENADKAVEVYEKLQKTCHPRNRN